MLTAVVDAPPVIVWLAASTCLISNIATVFAAMFVVGIKLTPLSPIVTVDVDAAVLDTTMFVTTALEPAGVVYRVVAVLVVAAVLASAFVVVAIISYLSFRVRP